MTTHKPGRLGQTLPLLKCAWVWHLRFQTVILFQVSQVVSAMQAWNSDIRDMDIVNFEMVFTNPSFPWEILDAEAALENHPEVTIQILQAFQFDDPVKVGFIFLVVDTFEMEIEFASYLF